MKSKLITVMMAAALCCGCATERAVKLNGKILNYAEGNYYQVTSNVGDTMFLREI